MPALLLALPGSGYPTLSLPPGLGCRRETGLATAWAQCPHREELNGARHPSGILFEWTAKDPVLGTLSTVLFPPVPGAWAAEGDSRYHAQCSAFTMPGVGAAVSGLCIQCSALTMPGWGL